MEQAAAAGEPLGEASSTPSGGAWDAASWKARIAGVPNEFVQRFPEHVLPLLFTGIGAVFLIEALDFPERGASSPRWISFIVMVVAFTQFLRQILTPKGKQVSIMDLGVLSEGMEGAKTAGITIIGLFALFGFVAMSVSFQAGAIALAMATPLPFMKRRTALITSAVAGLVLWLFINQVVERLMLPIWPQAPIRIFFFGG